ncbi:TetR/AcrR family transcriptional regulator [Streptomyces sp. ISID311]|uniref:TetR/AcrR family transcriptional regulator n=1 Tax=Streptomyces sp. ISID311 TaxID=2601673 RepID=UPI0011BD36EE|nr:TetR/AcrR family transcriptional regulator [Streptomyces sp. ISID311]TXD00137.1 TetR/AcrR family transcriptional regulator [Streptomyces sp. ISID311]
MSPDADHAPKRRPTRAETKARTRRLLLDAAARTYARKGFAGASVEEIAEAAGFSIGAVYSNFGSKERLFVELLRERASEQVSRATRIVADAQAGDDPVPALGRLLANAADKDPDFAPLQAEFWLYAVRNPPLMETLAEELRGPRAELESLMGKALEHIGAPAAVPADAVATIAMALFQGLLRQRRIDPASVPDELLGQAMQWLFAGIAASGTATGAQGPDHTDDTAATEDPAAADRPEENR